MTKSFFVSNQVPQSSYRSWEESIIAPKFNLKNFIDELHYYIRVYIIQKKPILKSMKFLFLNAIQRIFYTYGTFLIKLKFVKR